MDRPCVAIAGAGSVGCYIGGMLRLAGREVRFLGRQRMQQEISRHALQVSDYSGFCHTLSPDDVHISTSPQVLRDAEIILVTVKSNATAHIAEEIVQNARPSACIVSFQNGIMNADILRQRVKGRRVIAGMVPFNVVQLGEGRFHKGTSGDLVVEKDTVSALLQTPDMKLRQHADMRAVLWGKLLINLNNAINALSGLPLRHQIEDAQWRRVLARQIKEAHRILRQAGIRPVSALAIPINLLPAIFQLPTPVFRIVAQSMLKIDAKARSSMWEDLERGRWTEIDHLQGAILGVAQDLGVAAPLTQKIVDLIRAAERAGTGSPQLAVSDIWP